MYRYIVVLMIVASTLVSVAQEGEQSTDELSRKSIRKARDKYLGLGLGTAFIRVTDQATSPLSYRGWQFPAAKLDYLVHSKQIIKAFEADFSFGSLSTRTETPWYDPTTTSYFIALRYSILFRINTFANERVNWYLGPEININGHFRVNYKYGNSALTFDNYNGIGFASRLEFPFQWNARDIKVWFMNFHRRDRSLRLSWQLSMPLASLMIRPSYVTITNFIDPDLQARITSDHITGGFLVPLNIRSQAELFYILKNQNMLKLSYIWNFYSHDRGYNKVQSAYHGLLLSMIFKFNYKAVTR